MEAHIMSKYSDVMIDIETLGNRPYSLILSIAALEFNRRTGKTGREFYCIIDPVSCKKYDFKIDPETVLWWLGQSGEARGEFTGNKPKTDIKTALDQFYKFISKLDKNVNVWANSPSYDCSRIREAYELTGRDKAPWTYHQERDYRTIAAEHLEKLPRNKSRVAHNALDDCYNQVESLYLLLNRTGGVQ
jgi:hypothetical protein